MEVHIDKSGRIVVPKRLRDRMGFQPDMALTAIERPDGVLLQRVEEKPVMVKVDGLWVHRGAPIAGADWDRLIDDVRDERIDSVLNQ